MEWNGTACVLGCQKQRCGINFIKKNIEEKKWKNVAINLELGENIMIDRYNRYYFKCYPNHLHHHDL